MSRNQHSLIDDHFGVLDDAQLASGTPASGDAPLSNGDGTRTWGPAGGGGSQDLISVLTEGNDTGGISIVSDGGGDAAAAEFRVSSPDVSTDGATPGAGEDGGYIDLQGGGGDYVAGDQSGGGDVYIEGGFAAGSGGSIGLWPGYAKVGTDGDGGDIILEPGAGDGTGRDGLIIVSVPTGDPGVSGALYVDGSGFLKVSP